MKINKKRPGLAHFLKKTFSYLGRLFVIFEIFTYYDREKNLVRTFTSMVNLIITVLLKIRLCCHIIGGVLVS